MGLEQKIDRSPSGAIGLFNCQWPSLLLTWECANIYLYTCISTTGGSEKSG